MSHDTATTPSRLSLAIFKAALCMPLASMIVLLASGAVAYGASGHEALLFSNDQFSFYPDHMEARDVYKGVYRSTDGLTLVKDGDPTFRWAGARTDRLYLQTPYPILNAAFALAVDDAMGSVAAAGTQSAQLSGDVAGRPYFRRYFYLTHGKDIAITSMRAMRLTSTIERIFPRG